MTQLFHPSTNTLSRVSIFGALFVVTGAFLLMGAVNRSPYVTQQNVVIDQPVPFSHSHHVAGLGIDCRFCHTTVEQSASAGIPSSKVCMTCHSQIWTGAPMLEAVRESYRSDESIAWSRVHDLPDFAYFDHSIHLSKGIGCVSCHGRVDEMPLMSRANTLNMEWCLSCHREPERFVRPRDQLFSMDWTPESEGTTQAELGPRLVEEYHVRTRTSCSACHR